MLFFYVTLLQCHYIAISLCCSVTMLLCHYDAFLLCQYVTISLLYFTISPLTFQSLKINFKTRYYEEKLFEKRMIFDICHSRQSQARQGLAILELDRDKEYK